MRLCALDFWGVATVANMCFAFVDHVVPGFSIHADTQIADAAVCCGRRDHLVRIWWWSFPMGAQPRLGSALIDPDTPLFVRRVRLLLTLILTHD